MRKSEIYIPRLPDKTVFLFFKEAAKLCNVDSASFTTFAFGNLGKQELENPSEELARIIDKGSAIIETILMTAEGLNIKLSRSLSESNQNSGIFDLISFTYDPNNHQQHQLPPTGILADLVELASRKLKAFDPDRTTGGGAAQKKLDALHISTLERLEKLNEELILKTHVYREKLDTDFTKHRDELEETTKARVDILEKQHSIKLDELTLERENLQKQKEALDDKSNTHARREIRRDILKEIKARQTEFSLTKGTNKLRAPVALGMVILIAFFIFMVIYTSVELFKVIQSDDMRKIILVTAKQLLYSGGTVGSIIFAIRWLNRWFELHMQSEFALKQFELDMERASWLVETNLEWKDSKGTTMPTDLLKSLSKNLFENQQEKPESVSHPVDQLASALIGSASTIRLKAGDSLLEIDPKKLAKAKPVNNIQSDSM